MIVNPTYNENENVLSRFALLAATVYSVLSGLAKKFLHTYNLRLNERISRCSMPKPSSLINMKCQVVCIGQAFKIRRVLYLY